MKRTLIALILALSMLLGLCALASASDFDSAAQELSEIGVFRGTGGGFELDRAPTRAEAAVMLTRLYGAEESAEELYRDGEISHPFTDVPDYAGTSVAWLYAKGLTKGVSQTAFGAAQACGFKDYAVFLLRALGYRDGVDFSYADALEFAQKVGFYNPAVYTGSFLRDDLAGLTYDALCTDLKDGSTYLLKSLVDTGAIEKVRAAKLLEKAEAFRALFRASDGFDSTAIDMDYTMNLTMFTPGGSASDKVFVRSSGNVKFLLPKLQMDYTMKLSAEGESAELHIWMKDGMYYISQDGEQYRLDLSQLPQMQQLQSLMTEVPSQTVSSGMSGLSYLSDIKTTGSGSASVYTVKIPAKTVQRLLEDALRQTGSAEMADMIQSSGLVFTKELTVSYTVSGGRLTKIGVDMGMQYSDIVYLADTNGTQSEIPYNMGLDLSMDMSIRASGSAVKITFPDFSGFVSMDPETMARGT